MSEQPKIYLGDGAYAEFSGYDFRIYTSNGIAETNSIHLEPSAVQTLINWARQLGVTIR